jgi:tetratricopeptide (TPR) repeat protein
MSRSIEDLEKSLGNEGETVQRVVMLIELNDKVKYSDYPRSAAICREAISLASKLGERQLMADAQSDLANSLWKLGDMEGAQEHYQQALGISRELGYATGMVDAYCGLGIVHGSMDDYANALGYFEKGVKLAEDSGNDPMLAHNLGNIGQVYQSMEEHVTAMKYFAKALAIGRELGDEGLQGVSNMLGAIAGVMVYQEEYEGAVKNLEECISIDESIGNLRGKVVCLLNLGITYHKWGRHPEAITYFNRSLSFAKKIHFGHQIPQIHLHLSKVYEAIGETEDAIHHLRKYHEFRKEEKRMRVHLNASKAD